MGNGCDCACVVGGVSFTGGIGKISGVVVGVFIFTALTYSLTILGIDTNLQFVFSGIIILVAVALDCLKYVQKNKDKQGKSRHYVGSFCFRIGDEPKPESA